MTPWSLPGSSVYGISLTRILEWVTFSFSRDLPHPGIEPGSPALAGRFFTIEPPGKPQMTINYCIMLRFFCLQRMDVIILGQYSHSLHILKYTHNTSIKSLLHFVSLRHCMCQKPIEMIANDWKVLIIYLAMLGFSLLLVGSLVVPQELLVLTCGL